MKNPTWLKLLVLVLTFAMLLSLVACGPEEEETSGTTGTQAEQTTEGDDATTEKGDDATTEKGDDDTTETDTESGSASDTESEVGSETESDEETTTEKDEETTTEKDEETTTEKDEETTTEKDEETTTEKDEETTTEKDEETTTEKDDIPTEDIETAFDTYFGPIALSEKTLMTSSGATPIKATLAEDGKYVSFTRTELSGDFYTEFINGGATANGKYLVMKYRADKDSYVEIWSNTKVASYQVNVDGKNILSNVSKTIVADGNWQLLVVDLEELYSSKAAPIFEADENGNYTVKYLRLDLLDADRNNGSMDVEYIAICDDLADLKAHLGDEACPHSVIGEVTFKEGEGYVASCLICGENAGEPVLFLTTWNPKDLNRNWTTGPFIDEITEEGNWRVNVGENPTKLSEKIVEKGNKMVGPYMIVKYRASEDYTGNLQVYANTHKNSPFAKTIALKNANGDPLYVAYKLNPAATGEDDKYLDKNGAPCALASAATVNTAITPEGTPVTENCELKTSGGEFVKAEKNVAECNTPVISIKKDEEWHVLILDLNDLIKPMEISDGYETETFDPMEADENGKYTLAYLRFDAIEAASAAPVGSWIEYAYVGFSDNLDNVKSVIEIPQDDCSHKVFKKDAEGNVICTPVDADGHTIICAICDASVKVAHVAGELTWNGKDAFEKNCSDCGEKMASQPFVVTFDKAYFLNKVTIKGTEKSETADGGVRFTTTADTAAGDNNGRVLITTKPIGQYLIIKYKNSGAQTDIDVTIKPAAGGSYRGVAINYVTDDSENWQIVVVDVEKLFNNPAYVTADENGNFAYGELMLDVHNHASKKGDWIEYAYIGFSNDLAQVKAALGADDDYTCAHSDTFLSDEITVTDDNTGHGQICQLCGELANVKAHALDSTKPLTKGDGTHSGTCKDCGAEYSIKCTDSGKRGEYNGELNGYPSFCECGNIAGLAYFLVQTESSGTKSSAGITLDLEDKDGTTYTRYTSNGSDQSFYVYYKGTVKTGQYLVIRFRVSDGYAKTNFGATYTGTLHSGKTSPDGTGDGCGEIGKIDNTTTDWQISIIDLGSTKPATAANGEYIVNPEDGAYYTSYVRFTLPSGASNKGAYMDVDFVAFADDLGAVVNYMVTEDESDACVHNYVGESKWNEAESAYTVKCEICNEIVTSKLFPTTFDKDYFLKNVTINGTEKTETDGGVRFTTTADTAAGDQNGRLSITVKPIGKYLIIKYKNSGAQKNIDVTIKPATAGYSGKDISYVTNDSENWQLIVVNIENLFNNPTYVTTDENGNFTYIELLLDIHNTASKKGDWIEYAYIGFSNNIEHVIATLGDEIETEGDTCTHHSSLRGDTLVHENGDTHWYECQICGNMTGEGAHKPLAGAEATQAENNQHKIACACGYILTVDCAISGGVAFDDDDDMYHGACVCGRDFASYFLVQKESTSIAQSAGDTNKVTVTEADGAKTYTAIGTDAWFYLYKDGSKDVETGRYVVIKYKGTAPSLLAGFAGTVDGGNVDPMANGDQFKSNIALTVSEEWQIVILDLEANVKDKSKFADDGNENYYAKYLRFSIGDGKSITIDFVAFADEAAAIKNYVDTEWAGKYTCTHPILSETATKLNDANHAYDCLVCGEKVTQKHTLDGVAVEGSGNADGHQETCTVCNSAVATAHTAAGEKVWNGTAYATSCTKCSEDIAQPFLLTYSVANNNMPTPTTWTPDTSDGIFKINGTADGIKGLQAFEKSNMNEVVKYFIVKYRYNDGVDGQNNITTEVFSNTTHNSIYQNVTSTGDLVLYDDNQWHVLVFDLTKKLDPAKFVDGNPMNCFRIDYVNEGVTLGEGATLEYAYFGFENDLSRVKAALGTDTQYCQKHVGDGVYTPTETGHIQHCAVCGAEMAGEHSANGVYTTDGAKDANGHAEKCKYCSADMTVSHTAGEMTWNGTAYATSCSKCSEEMASQPFLATIWAKDLNSSGTRTTSTYVEATDDEVAYRQYKSTALDGNLGDASNDQYWTIFNYGANGPVTGQYFIMKYRNAYSSQLTIYKSTTAAGAGSSQYHTQTLDTNQGWHILIVDLTTVSNPITKDVDTNNDGENDAYAVNFMRFGFGVSVPADKVVLEVAYMGFSDDLSKVGLALDELDDNNYHKHTFETKASLNCKYCGAKPNVLSIDFVQEGSTNQQLNIPRKKNVTSVQGNPYYFDASATTFTKASIYFSGWAAVDQGIACVYYQINNGEWKVFDNVINPGSAAHEGVVNGTTTALTNYVDAMCFAGTINLAGENNENVGKIVTVRLAYTSRDDVDGEKEIFVVVENIKVYCEHQYSEEAPGSCSVCGQERYYVQMSTGGVKALTSTSQNVVEGTPITDPTSTTAYNGSHVAYSASGVSFVSSGAAIYLEGSVAINGGVEKYYYQTNNGLWVEWTGATVSDGTEIAGGEVGEELSDYTKNMNFSGVIELPSNTSTTANKTVKVAIAAMNADGEMFVIAVVNSIVISKVAS